MNIFRKLNEQEKKEFRQWARDYYEPLTEIKGIWHPEIQDECVKINKEYLSKLELEKELAELIEKMEKFDKKIKFDDRTPEQHRQYDEMSFRVYEIECKLNNE